MLLVVWIALQLTAAAPAAASRSLSVCEVLAEDPTGLNGKVIAVRGLIGGADEGLWLHDECKNHLVTRGLTWGSDLWVDEAGMDESAERSWRRMSDELTRLHARLGRDRIRVTIVGRIETRDSMEDEVVQMPYGLRRAGFGHMGGSPAAIHVLSVQDVTVESAAPALPSRTLSVCEVLADDPTKLNRQVVSVRGLLEKTQEGLRLRGECVSHLVTSGVTWENVISINGRAADEEAESSLRRLAERLTPPPNLSQDRIWLTIVGRIETQESMEYELIDEIGGLRKAGYGRKGDSPAEIDDVMSVRDVTVESPSHHGEHTSKN